MFGHNPLRKQHLGDGETLMVQGVPWVTIQGEGPLAGMPAVFIRLWGCNLRCLYCDTDFESDGNLYQKNELLCLCLELRQPLVVLTGGEPMRQNIWPLVSTLRATGMAVQIETAGTLWFQSEVESSLLPIIVVSPKTPKVHEQIDGLASAWKYIISHQDPLDPIDGLPCGNTQQHGATPHRLARPSRFSPRDIYVQPMDQLNAHDNQANVALCIQLAQKYGYRVSLQQHKILGVL